MRGEISSHAFSVILGLVVAVISFAATALLPSGYTAQAVGLSTLLGITTTIIYDRMIYIRKIAETKECIIRTLRTGEPFAKGFTYYPSERQALSYLTDILPNATSIKNTRFTCSAAAAFAGAPSRLDNHDLAIMSAIEKGADYHLICAKHRLVTLERFKTELHKRQQGSENIGNVVLTVVDFEESPVPQMIILQFSDGTSEVLFGWMMATDHLPAPVMAFRDAKVIAFFENLFDRYAQTGTTAPLRD